MDSDSRMPRIPWKGLLLVVAVILLLGGACSVFQQVDPGYEGIKINYNANTTERAGSGKWVQVWPGERLVEYPVAQVHTTLKKDDKADGSVACPTNDGVPLQVDATLFWRVDDSELVELFNLNTGLSIEGIESKVVRSIMPAAILRACSRYTWRDIHTLKTAEAQQAMTDAIKRDLDSQHLVVDQFILGRVHLPTAQQSQADLIVSAEAAARAAEFNTKKIEQEALSKQAEARAANEQAKLAADGAAAVAKLNTERDSAVAKTNADRDAAVLITKAQGDLKAAESQAAAVKVNADALAYQLRVEGQAKADALAAQANAVKGNAEYVRLRETEKWDGKRVPERDFIYGPNAVVQGAR